MDHRRRQNVHHSQRLWWDHPVTVSHSKLTKAVLQHGPGLGIHSKCQDLKTTLPSLTQQLAADVNGSPKPRAGIWQNYHKKSERIPFLLPVPTKLHLNASGGGKVQAFVRGCWCTTPGTIKHGLKGYHSHRRYAHWHNPMRIEPWCPEFPDTDCDAAGWRGRYPGDLNWNWWMADIPNQMNNAPSTETYHPSTQVTPGEGTKQLCSAMAGQRYASLPKGFSAALWWRDGSWAQVRWAWNPQVDTNWQQLHVTISQWWGVVCLLHLRTFQS